VNFKAFNRLMLFQTTSMAFCTVIVLNREREILFEFRNHESAQSIINYKLKILIW
jgi:hypothetical protein